MRVTFTFTITDRDDREVEITAVPVDPPDLSVGITGWTFDITATCAGQPYPLDDWTESRAADMAAELLRKEGWK